MNNIRILKKMRGDTRGFTLLELIIVLVLSSVILGLSVVFFANTLPSGMLNATARELSATIRHARTLSHMNGERQIVTLDLDSKKYMLGNRGEKTIPAEVNIKIQDPLTGEQTSGIHRIIFHGTGGAEGGTVVLWNRKRTVSLELDPVAGAVVIK